MVQVAVSTGTVGSVDQQTWYSVIGEPPFTTGAVQVTRARLGPAVATRFVGGSGGVGVTIGAEAGDAGPVPISLVAVTVNV